MGIGSFGSSDPSYVYHRLKVIESASGINAGDMFGWFYNGGNTPSTPPERTQPPLYTAMHYNVNNGCGKCEKCKDGYCVYNDLMPFNFFQLIRSGDDLEFHPRYEGKMWNYMQDHLPEFRQYLNDKTLFWIVGSQPSARAMMPFLKGRFGEL
jgi:hypothetical protein